MIGEVTAIYVPCPLTQSDISLNDPFLEKYLKEKFTISIFLRICK